MTKYKNYDKVVVELLRADELADRKITTIMGCPILGKLEDFQTAEAKIKFTTEEREEFEGLKINATTLFEAFGMVIRAYPHLYKRLYCNETLEKDDFRQKEFAEAWDKPSRIEVLHEDLRIVQVGDRNLWEHDGKYLLVNHCNISDEHYYFAKYEVERIAQLEQFKYIDLVAAWEDGE